MNPGHIIALALSELLLLTFFLWMPVVRTEALFGVPVSAEFYGGKGRKILRRFRYSLIPLYLVVTGLGFFFAWRASSPGIAIVAATIASLSVVPLYALSYRAVAPFWLSAKGGRVASSIRPRRLADYTSLPIELVVLLITLLPAVAAWLCYERMPARVPVHWNLMMVPDHWAPKTVGVVALMPALALHLQVFLLLLKRDTAGVKMRLPAQDTDEFLQAKEDLLALGLRLLDWTRLFLGVVLAAPR